jgi:hypothetical protein
MLVSFFGDNGIKLLNTGQNKACFVTISNVAFFLMAEVGDILRRVW